MTPEEYYDRVMMVPWYAVEDTLIGGWAVSLVDQPTHLNDRGSGVEVATFVCEDVAQHIAALHNTWLLDVQRLAQESE